MITLFLDPDGTHDLGSYVLVPHPTGIRYETQCNGTATEVRGAEGFLVSVGPSAAFEAVMAYFSARFARAAGRPPSRPVAEWSDDDRAELRRRVEALQTWITDDEGDAPRHLALDETRLGDSFEAWLAVVTPHGPGWLLGPRLRVTRAVLGPKPTASWTSRRLALGPPLLRSRREPSAGHYTLGSSSSRLV